MVLTKNSVDLGYFSIYQELKLKKRFVVVLIVLCLGVEFLCCLHLMHFFIVLVKFG